MYLPDLSHIFTQHARKKEGKREMVTGPSILDQMIAKRSNKFEHFKNIFSLQYYNFEQKSSADIV